MLYPILCTFAVSFLLTNCGKNFTTESMEGIVTVFNKNGSTLGYHLNSGVNILTVDRYAFKDLNKNGELDVYEDWRLPVGERAKNLASKMSVEEIAGLMLYSGHQSIPAVGRRGSTYDGKPYEESGADPSDLSDAQKKFLTEDNLRHVLITSVESAAVAAKWNNNAQALVEGIGLGIPVNASSDPRHGSDTYAEFNLAFALLPQYPRDIRRWAPFSN